MTGLFGSAQPARILPGVQRRPGSALALMVLLPYVVALLLVSTTGRKVDE